jgi:hypothetical protein
LKKKGIFLVKRIHPHGEISLPYFMPKSCFSRWNAFEFDAGYERATMYWHPAMINLMANPYFMPNWKATNLLHSNGRALKGTFTRGDFISGNAYVIVSSHLHYAVRTRSDWTDQEVKEALQGIVVGWSQIVQEGKHRMVYFDDLSEPALVKLAVG